MIDVDLGYDSEVHTQDTSGNGSMFRTSMNKNIV